MGDMGMAFGIDREIGVLVEKLRIAREEQDEVRLVAEVQPAGTVAEASARQGSSAPPPILGHPLVGGLP